MSYFTFISRRANAALHAGVGDRGDRVAEVRGIGRVTSIAASTKPSLWVCIREEGEPHSRLRRLAIPSLQVEADIEVARVGALACGDDPSSVVFVEIPLADTGEVKLVRLTGDSAERIPGPPPDISSQVAWTGSRQLAYEASDRRLCVIDMASGAHQLGPTGRNPAAALAAREWYAVVGTQAVRFPAAEPFAAAPLPLEGFSIGEPTSLRFTHDGNVCTWMEPKALYESRGYVQTKGGERIRMRALDDGIGAVIGPYSAGEKA